MLIREFGKSLNSMLRPFLLQSEANVSLVQLLTKFRYRSVSDVK